MINDASRDLRPYLNDISNLVGEFVRGIFLFGSRAAGTAREDSDYDVAILISEDAPLLGIRRRVSDAAFKYVVQGVDIRPVVLREHVFFSTSQFARHLREVGQRLV